MFNNTKMQSNFLSLIAKFGKPYTLTRSTKTDVLIDPARPTKGYVTINTNYAITGFASTYDRRLVNSDGLIKITDIPLYVSGNGITFSSDKTDKISDGTNSYSIVNIIKYDVGDKTIYYELQLRS